MRILKLFILFSIVLLGCKTNEPQTPPTVITKMASDVTLKNATLNGEVVNEGFSATSDRGFVYSDKNTNPTLVDSKVQTTSGKGIYSIALNNLSVNTKYFYRAYAINSIGKSYGEAQSFNTADFKLPTALTDVPKNISYTTVELGGSVTDEGGGNVSENGFIVSLNSSPKITDLNSLKFPISKGKVTLVYKANGLSVNSKYFVSTYAINEKGIAYGNVQSFITNDYKLPIVITDSPKNINSYKAELGGGVTDDGGLEITQRGICFGLNPNPTISDEKIILGYGLVSLKNIILQNLKYNSKYYVRAYAINYKGIGYGNEQVFNTLKEPLSDRDDFTKVVDVKSKTGRIWMDRNLGASQAAKSSTDPLSFGDLYQWGRRVDGHQNINSKTTNNLSNEDKPLHGDFIISSYWRSPIRVNLWQGVNGINNTCPIGYRLPTREEWNSEMLSWNSSDSKGAFASPLKLPMPGYRSPAYGTLRDGGTAGYYWSSSAVHPWSVVKVLYFLSSGATPLSESIHSWGFSIRCIKD